MIKNNGTIARISKKDFIVLVEKCQTQAEILRKLGLRVGGANYDTLRKRLKEYNLLESLKERAKLYISEVNKKRSNKLIEEYLCVGSRIHGQKLKKKLISRLKTSPGLLPSLFCLWRLL